ncbi:MAG: hypothetical protein IAI48_02655 [Candidatus Eremiobacteraeota bacterium]|nr:hypothetical protein [Candidatus Eremiobacteraeota bacterium]
MARADTAAAKPGLAPQFSRWSVPIYTSRVTSTMTWAANSYEIETSDSRPKVIAWYLDKLKNRAMQLHKDSKRDVPAQLAIDGGSYIINLETAPSKTSINVIKIEAAK